MKYSNKAAANIGVKSSGFSNITSKIIPKKDATVINNDILWSLYEYFFK